MKAHYFFSLCCAVSIGTAYAQPSTSTDLWDVSQGAVVTASSPVIPGYSIGAMFGEGGQNFFDGQTWTYFADFQPPGTIHTVEWEMPGNVTVGKIRLFAFGDGPTLNNGREFNQVTIKAKSPGSLNYDITVLTFTPTHPYTFVDPNSFLILDQVVAPVTAQS